MIAKNIIAAVAISVAAGTVAPAAASAATMIRPDKVENTVTQKADKVGYYGYYSYRPYYYYPKYRRHFYWGY